MVWSLLAVLSQAGGAAVTIDHRAVGCMVAERFPVLEARIAPADGISRARVFFRASGTPAWYFVDMRPERDAFVGVLPKPLKSTKAVEYYVQAVDSSLREGRTADANARVAESAAGCPAGALAAGVLASASVVVSGAAGGAALPVGFSSVGLLPGGIAGAAAGGAGSGGGLSTGAILGIVGGAAVAAAGVVVATGGSEEWVGTGQYFGTNPTGTTCTQTQALTLEIEEDGSTLGGKITTTVTASSGTAPGCNPTGFTHVEEIQGSLSGSSVTFTAGPLVYSGTRTGTTMQGTLTGALGQLSFNGTWSVTLR
jgi:hypothetical protein